MKRIINSKTFRTIAVIVMMLGQISISHAKSIKVESFAPDPFDLSASTNQKTDYNGEACALIKLELGDGIRDASFEGNIIEKINDGSEILAYFTNGTKQISVKIPGYAPVRIVFSNYGVYRLLSKQVYRLSLSISNEAADTRNTVTSQSISIHDLLDKTPDGDPVDDMVSRANKAYSDGKYEDAISLLTKAADLGHPEAQLSLGILYENGIGEAENWILRPNEKKAFLYVQKSAHQGYAPAQKIMSRYYKTGVGGNLDKERGETWKKKYEKTVRSQDPDANQQDDRIFDSVEEDPEFPGGVAAMYRWIGDHLRYPEVAQENGIQGRVVVRFVVTKTGSIGEVRVARSKDPDLDKEAVRVVKSLPRFYPGKMNGHPVNVWFTMPITFKLEGL